ncbi:SCA7, zinc-binding domain-containing protein [Spinellus fusiger]|nr:SCA7, zinc-binding domain-containing protein [Spinellus fusiger]
MPPVFSEEQQTILNQKGYAIEQLQTDDDHWNSVSLQHNSRLLKKHSDEFENDATLKWDKLNNAMSPDGRDLSDDDGVGSTTLLDAKERTMFGVMPMKEDVVTVKCKYCERPILASSFSQHAEICSGNGLSASRGPFTPIPSHYSSYSKGMSVNEFFSEEEEDSDGSVQTKQRKHGSDPKKKHDADKRSDSIGSLEEGETSSAKQHLSPDPSSPLDLNRQCGVLQGPNNTPCARSLTCKSHSMGAKRAVEGRSQAYNDLLAAYQKKGVGRPQVGPTTATATTATLEQPANTTAHVPNPKTKVGQISVGIAVNTVGTGEVKSAVQLERQTADSDEEVENVMKAFQSHSPCPLAQKPIHLYKRKRRNFKIGDILRDAITPKKSFSISSQDIPTVNTHGMPRMSHPSGMIGFSDVVDTTATSLTI